MQKLIPYFLKLSLKGLIIGIIIAVIMMSLEMYFGRQYQWDAEMLREFFYDVLFGLVLTVINGSFFDYLNKGIRWAPEWERYRILIAYMGSVPLTMLGVWFVRLLIIVGFENQAFEDFVKNDQAGNYVVPLIITLIVALFFHAFIFYKKLQEKKVKEQKLIAGNVSAQFESLKNQIDPHFLFNSLNVLNSLIEENPEKAQKFTTSLSKIYRYVLEQKDKELVPLEEELNFAKTYMKLLSMRFENSLTYSLPETLPVEEAKVVPLSLQLILENAIKHNVVSDIHPLHISIFIQDDYLVVSNNLQKKEALQKSEGVGLKNIINRYAILTEKKVKVETDDATFTIKIPLLSKQLNIVTNSGYNEVDVYLRAKKQVKDIKEFYGNLLSYLIMMPIFIFINYKTYWDFKWFLFPMLGWGLALILQAFSTFGYGKAWEERKISEFMEKEQQSNHRKWE